MKTQLMLLCLVLLSLTACDQLGLSLGQTNQTPVTPAEIRQWATQAKASSSFAGELSESPDDQSPFAAIGEPDVKECGSYEFERYAWAPSEEDAGPQWLELTFTDSVFVSEVNIREVSPKGAIVKVEADDSGKYKTLWQGKDSLKTCPGYLEIKLENMTEFATNDIKITLDTSVSGWNMIDAAELVGYSQRWKLVNNTIIYE